MQEVHDAGCKAIVEWVMSSTPVKRLVEVMDDALRFHQAQLRLATRYLHE
jgi:hypothetical protein